jgi:DNA repair protein RecO (recombination protein O)
MAEEFKQAEGMILRVIPFRDYDQILTLFTREQGVIKLIYKGSRSPRRGAQGICMPLTVVDVIYREKRGELFACQEMTWVNSYQTLRQSLPCLEAACDCLQALYLSQLVGKPAPLLYELMRFYLNRMDTIHDPWILALSFRLKLLGYDGLACFPFICSVCSHPLYEGAYVHLTEWGCSEHLNHGSYWSTDNIQQVYRLTVCQSYQELSEEILTEELKEKIISFFNISLQK